MKDDSCSGLCAIGYFCPAGSTTPTSVPCPAGRYGAASGLENAGCSGLCREGFYCPMGSTNDSAVPCGDASLYCPLASASPIAVSAGYFTTGGDSRHRSSQSVCPLGSFCYAGEKYICPPGSFGAQQGLFPLSLPVLDPNHKYDFLCSG